MIIDQPSANVDLDWVTSQDWSQSQKWSSSQPQQWLQEAQDQNVDSTSKKGTSAIGAAASRKARAPPASMTNRRPGPAPASHSGDGSAGMPVYLAPLLQSRTLATLQVAYSDLATPHRHFANQARDMSRQVASINEMLMSVCQETQTSLISIKDDLTVAQAKLVEDIRAAFNNAQSKQAEDMRRMRAQQDEDVKRLLAAFDTAIKNIDSNKKSADDPTAKQMWQAIKKIQSEVKEMREDQDSMEGHLASHFRGAGAEWVRPRITPAVETTSMLATISPLEGPVYQSTPIPSLRPANLGGNSAAGGTMMISPHLKGQAGSITAKVANLSGNSVASITVSANGSTRCLPTTLELARRLRQSSRVSPNMMTSNRKRRLLSKEDEKEDEFQFDEDVKLSWYSLSDNYNTLISDGTT